jgi:diacylglycerol kinase family enzyme
VVGHALAAFERHVAGRTAAACPKATTSNFTPAAGVPLSMMATESALERAEDLAERVLPERTAKRRMLVIANPYATTVSNRLKNLVVYALGARYEVEAVETEARAHATELCREAAAARYDVVVAFGGDGTVNEAADGLAGSDTALTCLPGGSTNVFCRMLGIPADVVDATEHLLALADDFRPRRVDLGTVDDRHFVFAAGVGLDASVVERVDSRPQLKASMREWYFAYAAITTFVRRYLVAAPRVRVEADGRSLEGVTVIAQNGDPFTFFGKRPIRVCEGAGLDRGSISLAVLKRATALELPTLLPRIFSGRASTVQRARQVDDFPGVRDARITSVGEEPFPLEVDGDYLGQREEVRLGVRPGVLAVVG